MSVLKENPDTCFVYTFPTYCKRKVSWNVSINIAKYEQYPYFLKNSWICKFITIWQKSKKKHETFKIWNDTISSFVCIFSLVLFVQLKIWGLLIQTKFRSKLWRIKVSSMMKNNNNNSLERIRLSKMNFIISIKGPAENTQIKSNHTYNNYISTLC